MDEITVSTKNSLSSSAKYNVHSHLLSLLLSVHCLPGYFNLALTLFSEIQISAMLTVHVSSHFGSQGQDSVVQGVRNLTSALTFQFPYDFSGEDNFTNAVAGLIGVYFLLVFLVALTLAILYVMQRPCGVLLPKIWSFLGSTHHTAVFLFIQYFALSLLRKSRQRDGLEDKFMNKHEAVAMAAVYMTLNILFGLITARFKINEIKGNDIMATRTPWFAVLGLLYKLALSISLSQATNDKFLHWCDVLIGIVFLSSRLYQYITEFSFYNYKIFKLFLLIAVFQQTELGINTFWLLVSMKRNVSLTIVLCSYAVFGAILIHTSYSFVYHVVRRNAVGKIARSEKEFFIKMFAWEKIIERKVLLNQDGCNEYGVLFHHLVEKHAKDCVVKECGCKFVLFQRSLELGLFKESDRINMDAHSLNYELIKGLYAEGIKTVNKNSLIKLQFANFLINNDENSITNAIYLVNSAYSKDTLRQLGISTLRETALAKIENRIENILKTQKSGLQTKQFVDYNIQRSIFRKEVAENTKLYMNFWITYSKPNPLIHQLLKQNIRINRKAEELKISWDNLSLNHSRFCRKDYIINGLYMQIIRNAPYTAENLFERYHSLYQSELASLKEGQGKEVFNASSNNKDIYLCVSLNQENFAHIVFASQNVKKLGFCVEELKNHSAAILMPLFFAKKHSKFLLKEITENHLNMHLNKEISVFVRDKQGYILPAKLYLTVFPYLKKGFYCLARIKLEKNSDNYLFMLPSGKIEGGTREISERLNLEYAHGTHSNILIHDVCFFGHRLFESTESKVDNYTTEEMQITTTEVSKPSLSKGRNFTETIEQQNEEIKISPRKYSTSPKNLRPSKFQKYGSPKNNQTLRGETMEDRDGTPGIRMKFFPYRRNIQEIQDRINSYMIFLTTVTLFTHEDQVLYIIQLRDTNSNKGSKSVIKSLRAGYTTVTGGGSPKERKLLPALNFTSLAKESFDNMTDSEVMTIPNESERNLEPLSLPAQRSVRMDFLTVETPHTLFSQERLLSTESENPAGNQTRRNYWKGEHEDNLRGERRRIVENIQPLSEGTSKQSRMNAREMNVLMSVERAIHHNKMPVSYGLVKISVIGFILLSVVLFAYYQIEGNKKFDLLINNTEILEYSLTVLYYMNECTRTVTPVKLIDLGYIPKNRNGGGQFDLSLIRNFGYIVPNLTQANNKLRNSMSLFNKEQREKFYELIPVIQSDNLTENPSFNAFDIHAQLISSGLKLYKHLPTIPKNNNPDLNFIFNNTINDLLIHDRAISSLLQEEDKRIVDGMASFVLTLLGIMLGTGIVVIGVLIRNEVRFIKKKMLFLEYFLRIGEKDVDRTIVKSTKFYEALRDSNYSEEDILCEVQSENRRSRTMQTEEEQETLRAHQNFLNKRKKANFRSINKDSWVGVLTLIFFILWFWCAYGIFYNEFLVQSRVTQEYKSQIIETSLFLSKFSQALQYLYIYLGGLGDIHVLGNPIAEAWEKNYKELIQFNDYFTELMNIEYNVRFEKTIKTLIHGDICALVVQTATCYNDGKGSKLQGILGISNYEVNSMMNLKNKYDLSDKSVASRKAVYSDKSYAELERIYFSTMMPTYRRLQDTLKEVFLLAVSDFKEIIFRLNKIWLATFLILGGVYWQFGLKRMEREKVYFRAILRVIPVQVILTNKFLQHYMMKDSKRNFYF